MLDQLFIISWYIGKVRNLTHPIWELRISINKMTYLYITTLNRDIVTVTRGLIKHFSMDIRMQKG